MNVSVSNCKALFCGQRRGRKWLGFKFFEISKKAFPSGSNISVSISTSFKLIRHWFFFPHQSDIQEPKPISNSSFDYRGKRIHLNRYGVPNLIFFFLGNICCAFHGHTNFRTLNDVFELYIFLIPRASIYVCWDSEAFLSLTLSSFLPPSLAPSPLFFLSQLR